MRKQEKTKVRERIARAEKYWREPLPATSVSPGPSSAPTNSNASTTTKTPKTAATGQKRPLAERTDNETNSVLKKKLNGTRKIAEPKPRKQAVIPMEVVENEENMDEDECSSLSRSSGLSIASRDRMNLRRKLKQTPKTTALEIY